MLSSKQLKNSIYRELKQVGFKFKGDTIIPPNPKNKNALRRTHKLAKQHLLLKNKKWILKNEKELIEFFANGKEIQPEKISPKLVLVDNLKKSNLFRYATFLWSIPISNGFGRRLRYLIMDKSNNKIIGILGLTDPVINLKVRENHIGWDTQQKQNNLWHVMDLYVFGAVPPYNQLLGGKLVATLATSDKVRADFIKKYSSGRSYISGKNYKSRKGGLVLITTTGAFGESSILDGLKTKDMSKKDTEKINKKENNRLLWQFLGFTQGYGFFHLNNGIATKMYNYLVETENDIVKKNRFGDGSNWKMRVINQCMKEFGMNSRKYGKHGIKRGFYIAPLAKNFKEFLNGDVKKPIFYRQSTGQLFSFFRERYLLPRAERDLEWKKFDRNTIKVSKKLSA